MPCLYLSVVYDINISDIIVLSLIQPKPQFKINFKKLFEYLSERVQDYITMKNLLN